MSIGSYGDLIPFKELQEMYFAAVDNEKMGRILFQQIKERTILVQEQVTKLENDSLIWQKERLSGEQSTDTAMLILRRMSNDVDIENMQLERLGYEAKELGSFLNQMIRDGLVTLADCEKQANKSNDDSLPIQGVIKNKYQELFKLERLFRFELHFPHLIKQGYIKIIDDGLLWEEKKGGNLTLAAYFGMLQEKNAPYKNFIWKSIEDVFHTRALSQHFKDFEDLKKGKGPKWSKELKELKDIIDKILV
ncbi:hypothetical protein [Treponema primitia]|uniref:hypothetical protein n=1 Tax=Treponema primitia TaxID=88058 RepID=UPI0002554FD0|nr:hypothetical protein [Treponema primitia]